MKSKQPSKAMISTAYHEAGHAVMGFMLGIRIRNVSIVPDESTFGRVEHSSPLKSINLEVVDKADYSRFRMEKNAIMAFAGALAEKKFNPHGFRKVWSITDWEIASSLIERYSISPEEHNAYVKLLQIRAKALVEVYWPDIEDLASLLLEKEKLSGKAVRKFIELNPVERRRLTK